MFQALYYTNERSSSLILRDVYGVMRDHVVELDSNFAMFAQVLQLGLELQSWSQKRRLCNVRPSFTTWAWATELTNVRLVGTLCTYTSKKRATWSCTLNLPALSIKSPARQGLLKAGFFTLEGAIFCARAAARAGDTKKIIRNLREMLNAYSVRRCKQIRHHGGIMHLSWTWNKQKQKTNFQPAWSCKSFLHWKAAPGGLFYFGTARDLEFFWNIGVLV